MFWFFPRRDDWELKLQSCSMDQKHDVVILDALIDEDLMKDFSTLNGTVVNDVWIPEWTSP